MERVGWTGNLSLRYGLSQRSFENEASSSAMESRPATMRNSDEDVDFDDVFGGPLTRTRYSFGGSRIKSSEESTSSPTGLCERPVFGESYSSPRRRTSDDFYDDIFRRSDESVRSPRWSSPTSGSRTLSPSDPKIEPYATSVPTEFSLPAKMNKAADVPVFGSNLHTPNTSLSRFSSGKTTLSRASSGVKDSLYSTRSTENEIDQKSKIKTTRTGSPSSEFHFSIHKWANVGVPLIMSLRGGIHPTLKGSSKVSALSMEHMQDSGFLDDDLSAQKEDSGIEKETLMVKQEVNEHELKPPAPSSLLNDETERKGYEEAGRDVEPKENLEKNLKKVEVKKMNTNKKTEANKPVIGSPKSSPKNRVKGMVKDFFKMSNQESPPKTKTNVSSRWKPSIRSRTQEEVDEIISKLDTTAPEDNVEINPDASKNTKLASELPAENVKITTNASKTTKSASKWAAENVKTTPNASKSTKSASELSAENVKNTPNASKTTRSASELPAENVETTPNASKTSKSATELPAENVKMAPDVTSTVKEQIGRSNKPKFAKNRPIRKLEDINFQKDASESVPKANVENIDDPSLDNFQVEELATVEDTKSKTQEESEAIMALDSKIHMWSSGRKGNIRSLLSTLQLVLWAGSGWKPVALVDIIESNAVKKAYNRAMLCLHPDKLQQKGADAHKKYTAEKVFDILQEAWDHFNTLGTLL